MNPGSPGQRAVADFEIEDVFLIGTETTLDPQFNQTELIQTVAFQHRVVPGPMIYGQSRTPADPSEPEVHIVRYVIVGEVRILRPGVEPADAEVAESDVLAKIKLTYAADYRCSKAMLEDQDAVRSFGKNAIFHVWPYWREGVHEFAARMRLPRITVPMLKPTAPTQAGRSGFPEQVADKSNA